METLKVEDFKVIFKEIGKLMNKNKEYLCKLDGALGDGDIGVTMNTGFSNVNLVLEEEKYDDIGELLIKSGTVMSDKAPSTMGTLLAFGFLNAGKSLKGVKEVNISKLYELFTNIAEEIIKRGKAEVGDKTILDSLVPGANAIKTEINDSDNPSLTNAIASAYEEARKGMEETTNMKSNKGRASRYLEKSVGKQDPGATVAKLIFEGFYNSIKFNDSK